MTSPRPGTIQIYLISEALEPTYAGLREDVLTAKSRPEYSK
jgi:hypothetical protein